MIPKFRAWDEEDKKIFNVARFDFADYTVYSHLFACEGYLGEDLEIMQSTGIKDKNGAEIFEGDIVKDTNEEIGYITFLKQEMGYVIVYKNRDRRLGHRNGIDDFHLEIIGNIYEHPHLLKE